MHLMLLASQSYPLHKKSTRVLGNFWEMKKVFQLSGELKVSENSQKMVSIDQREPRIGRFNSSASRDATDKCVYQVGHLLDGI